MSCSISIPAVPSPKGKITPEIWQLTMLHKASRAISSNDSIDGVLAELIDMVMEIASADACFVYLLNAGANDVVMRACHPEHLREVGRLRLRMGEGVAGWAAEHNAVVALSSNAYQDPRFKSFANLAEDAYEALLSAPLISNGAVTGVINVHHRAPHAHTPNEVAMLRFVGEQMGVAIASAQLAEANRNLQEEAAAARQQLEDRKYVERAKGVLQLRFNLSEPEAYLRMRDESRRARKPLREIAQAILLVDELAIPKAQNSQS